MFRDPPATVGELADALDRDVAGEFGTFRGDGLSGTYAFDIHHEEPRIDPATLRGRRLTSFVARFPQGRARAEEALLAAHGAPSAVAGRRRYGAFFVDASDEDAFTLEWHAAEPDWAKPPADVDAVRALAARLLAGEEPEGTLTFDPPVPALAFLEAIGDSQLVAETVGIYMATWRVRLTAAPYDLEVMLEGRASGGPVPGVTAPAAAVAYVGPDDRIARLTVTRRSS